MKNSINIQESPIVTFINIHTLEQEIIKTKAQTGLLKGLIAALKAD